MVSPEYLRILPRSAARILALPEAERYKLIAAALYALQQPATPKDLATEAKAAVPLVAQHEASEKDVAGRAGDLNVAILGVQAARGEWFAAYKGLHGQLVARFKTDKERVDSYFMDLGSKSKTKAEEPLPSE